jgi:hypothetical protein
MQCICDRPPADAALFRIYWIIDVLDECESTSRFAFTKVLAKLGEEHCGVCFKLLFLSRYIPDIAKVSDTAVTPTNEMKTSNNDHDIQQFVTTNICTSSLGSLPLHEREILVKPLKERANGSFLWVRLVMEELEYAIH